MAAAADAVHVAELEARADDQARLISELEARVALLERESRSDRGTHAKPTETVRIGESRARARSSESSDFETDGEEPETLRLTSTAPAESWTAPSIPPGVAGTLPVVPLPEASAPEPVPASAAAPQSADPRASYRAALALLRERRFEEAAEAFGDWAAAFPEHPLLESALYWQGEAHYAERHYAEALERFEAVATRFPGTDRLADVLVKIGLCRRHLGDAAGARTYFERVRAEFPGTSAARLVPAEGAS